MRALGATAPLATLGALMALLVSAAPGAAPAATTRSCGNESELGARLGRVALLRAGALHVVDLANCVDHPVARKAQGPVRFSGDGRWLAFGEAQIVPASGGAVQRPFARRIAAAPHAWAWAPEGHRFAAVTKRGGVDLWSPGSPGRQLLRDGWGASELFFAPDGSLVVARSRYPKAKASNYHQEIWMFLGPSYTPNQVFALRRGVAPPRLATVAPDGSSVFFWLDPQNSASLAADGLDLRVKGTASGVLGALLPSISTLLYDEFFSWCGRRLVVVAGGDRYATHGKRLVITSPPGPGNGPLWRTRELSRDGRLSWISPACTPQGGRIAASAGRNWIEPRFGLERRAIWLLSADGSERRRLTRPLRGATDELPRWTSDGRAILFWRTRADGRGSLYAVRPDTARLFGPLAHAKSGASYYGRYGFAYVTDAR